MGMSTAPLSPELTHGRTTRLSPGMAREMSKTLTPAQEIAHIENELRALGYTKSAPQVGGPPQLSSVRRTISPPGKSLEELRMQRRTGTGVKPEVAQAKQEYVEQDNKVYRNARACTGSVQKIQYPGPHERSPPKTYEVTNAMSPPQPTRPSPSRVPDDAEYWSDDDGTWQKSNKYRPGARRIDKVGANRDPDAISKTSLKKYKWQQRKREWRAETGQDGRGEGWRGVDAYGNDPDFSGGKYRRGAAMAEDEGSGF